MMVPRDPRQRCTSSWMCITAFLSAKHLPHRLLFPPPGNKKKGLCAPPLITLLLRQGKRSGSRRRRFGPKEVWTNRTTQPCSKEHHGKTSRPPESRLFCRRKRQRAPSGMWMLPSRITTHREPSAMPAAPSGRICAPGAPVEQATTCRCWMEEASINVAMELAAPMLIPPHAPRAVMRCGERGHRLG